MKTAIWLLFTSILVYQYNPFYIDMVTQINDDSLADTICHGSLWWPSHAQWMASCTV